jgi:FkbM family methyltransferase
MKTLNRITNLSNRIISEMFKLGGKDWLTSTKIHGRKDLKLLGSKYGGWVIPTALFDSQSICYCVGCGDDISFDLELINKFNCNVFGFDPTPKAIEYVKGLVANNPKYILTEVGLWDKEDTLKFYVPKNPNHISHSLTNLQKTEDYIQVKVKRLKEIMKENGHEKLDLIKLDIEGAEYRVLESIINDNLDIKIICVEYDECFAALDNQYKSRIRSSVNSLLKYGYSMVCSQGNGNYTFIKNH